MSGLTLSPAVANGGGGSANLLPVWTFDSGMGGPPSGTFQTNNAAPSSTTSLTFSDTTKTGTSGWMTYLGNLVYSPSGLKAFGMCFTSLTTGKASVFEVTGTNPGNGVVTIGAIAISDHDNWSGDYALSFIPYVNQIESVLVQSGLTPISDGTYSIAGPNSPGTITFSRGICTAYTPNS